MQAREIKLNVADMVISLAIEPGISLTGQVDSFLADTPAEAVVCVQSTSAHHQSTNWRQLSTGERFGWRAFGTADGQSILVERLGSGLSVRYAAKPMCRVVDVFVHPPEQGAPRRDLSIVEILPLPVVALLAGHRGLFLHSCAVALEQKGILFTGVSGSGKSTMADLWQRFGPPSSSVIDDEHILARQVNESTLIYGAPWTRGSRAATFSRTPLTAIFFVSHGRQNQFMPLSPREALAELLSQVFLPVWSRDQLELTLQTCAALLQGVACYRLPFVPDERIVGFVQDVIGGCA